jgi:2-keto-3-deoxy-L-rhamnonate aldolase RhmA
MYEIKKKLKDGKLMIGTMVSELRNPNIVYMLGQCGFDFIIIDNEHGAYSPETVPDIIAASRGAGIPIIVRIPEIRRETILKPLDSGAAGLLVPQVNTTNQAKEIIEHAKYPPIGNRGVGLRRAHSLYHKVVAADYLKKANEGTFIAVQAENPTAIKNVEKIASIPGIDSIFIGPMDLSVSLGVPGQVTHPDEEKTINYVCKVCLHHNIVPGIMMFNIVALKNWIKKGMRFVVYSSDIALLADMAVEGLKELKQVDKT